MDTSATPAATTPPCVATVGRAHGFVECAIAVSMLDAAGVLVLAHPWKTASVRWDWMSALGGIELCVPAHQAEMAMDILASFDPAPGPRRSILGVLMMTVFFLWAFLWAAVPPPASGFYVVRPMATRAPRTGLLA